MLWVAAHMASPTSSERKCMCFILTTSAHFVQLFTKSKFICKCMPPRKQQISFFRISKALQHPNSTLAPNQPPLPLANSKLQKMTEKFRTPKQPNHETSIQQMPILPEYRIRKPQACRAFMTKVNTKGNRKSLLLFTIRSNSNPFMYHGNL